MPRLTSLPSDFGHVVGHLGRLHITFILNNLIAICTCALYLSAKNALKDGCRFEKYTPVLIQLI